MIDIEQPMKLKLISKTGNLEIWKQVLTKYERETLHTTPIFKFLENQDGVYIEHGYLTPYALKQIRGDKK